MEKIKIKEAIVVEGRDDIAVVERTVDTLIIATHGFGIRRKTWELIERAYKEKGIIILTDPDYSGEEIRRKLTDKFPNAKQAYLPKHLAMKGDDIGIENATPEDVVAALEKVQTVKEQDGTEVSKADMVRLGYSGIDDATARRELLAEKLGIGMGNTKGMLRMINGYGISLEEVESATLWVNSQRNQK